MLIVPPRLLVADEISLGLAPVMIDAVYDGLRRINGAGTALLIVEQQVDRVLDIAATAVVLEHGAVAYRGPASGAMAAVERVLAAQRRAQDDAHLRRRPTVRPRPAKAAGSTEEPREETK